MSVFVERLPRRRGIMVARMTADCRGELFAFADKIGLGVPVLHDRGAPVEHVLLTPLLLRAALARGAWELTVVDGIEHVRPAEQASAPQLVSNGLCSQHTSASINSAA